MDDVNTKKAGEHAVRFAHLVGEIAGEYDASGDVREILYGMAAAFKMVCEDLGADPESLIDDISDIRVSK